MRVNNNFAAKNTTVLSFRTRNKGFGLLFLLLAIAVVVITYILILNPRPDSDSLKIQKQSPEKYPWVEEDRIKESPEDIAAADIEQPKIKEATIYAAKVKKENRDRGVVLVKIDPKGLVETRWSGAYKTKTPRMDFEIISSSTKGSIDPTKKFQQGEDIDYEKLYLITKGNFSMLETNHENGRVRTVSGFLYITGWLNNQQQIQGYVSITSDKKNVKIFNYTAEKTDLKYLPTQGNLKNLIKTGLGN